MTEKMFGILFNITISIMAITFAAQIATIVILIIQARSG